ncbi:MAG: helix-turn-helix transcriptional regulator [Clostridia bacterium]|nr:helix-turn-helix transcriptional regulator [Clostridia bacterium]
MKSVSIQELCYTNVRFEITDVFPERWILRREFSMYKTRPRPHSAFFFVCSEITVTFYPSDGSPAVTAHRGDVVFIPRNILYHVQVSGSAGQKQDTYTVNLHLFDGADEECLVCDRIAILANRLDNLQEAHLKRLSDAFHSADGAARNLARVKGEFYLLLDLISASGSRNEDYYYPIRRGAEAFCDEWNKNEKIEKYAQLSGVSVTYFYRCFRNWTGKSPAEYRNGLRLSNAESLLRSTDMQIREIAATVGFEDPFYFCRIFSDAYGASPKLYRKRFREDIE